MRTIDGDKRDRVVAAVCRIVRRDGLPALSMGKVAREAGVSSGTPYVYFEDKADMLSAVFLRAKALLDEGLDERVASAPDVREAAFRCVMHFVEASHAHPDEAAYVRALCANRRLLAGEAAAIRRDMSGTVYGLYRRALAEGALRVEDADATGALLYGPALMAVDAREASGGPWDPADLEPIVRGSLHAALKEPGERE